MNNSSWNANRYTNCDDSKKIDPCTTVTQIQGSGMCPGWQYFLGRYTISGGGGVGLWDPISFANLIN